MRYIHDKSSHNKNAAQKILPSIIKIRDVKSVLDIGCGIGTWLAVAKELGIKDILGVDGVWVNRDLLEISNENFINHDLSQPLFLKKKFDLVIALEVAEHIEKESAEIFIESLIRHSDFILFSAAIKYQGGQNHINEQNPDYWCKIFNSFGFEFYDVLRPIFWNNKSVEYWYKQNIFLVARKGVLDKEYQSTTEPLTLVHPELLYIYQNPNFNPVIKELGLSSNEVTYILNKGNRAKIAYLILKKLLKSFFFKQDTLNLSTKNSE